MSPKLDISCKNHREVDLSWKNYRNFKWSVYNLPDGSVCLGHTWE